MRISSVDKSNSYTNASSNSKNPSFGAIFYGFMKIVPEKGYAKIQGTKTARRLSTELLRIFMENSQFKKIFTETGDELGFGLEATVQGTTKILLNRGKDAFDYEYNFDLSNSTKKGLTPLIDFITLNLKGLIAPASKN